MSQPARIIRIVVVDDHPLVREGLTTMLSRQEDMEIVGEADGVSNALAVFKETEPHVAIIDISLKDGNGIELIKQIKSKWEGIRILVSSMHDEMVYAERALAAGAKGYVHKEEGSQKIVDGVRRIMDGHIFVSQPVSDRLLARAAKQDGDVSRSPVAVLSDRELEVFELIGEGLSKRKIAERLHLSTKTIDTHRQNIKTKLDLADASELAHYATQWMMNVK
jgi:DNA-binding NarL/FixJ family response regulator